MIKRLELSNPDSCMSRARDDEMTFVLLARDLSAPETIRFWVGSRLMKGLNDISDPQITEALDCANAMEKQSLAPRIQTKTYKIEYIDVMMRRHKCYMAFKTDLTRTDYINTLAELGCKVLSAVAVP